MWLEKASKKTYGNVRYIIEEFLDSYGYNEIKVDGKDKINNVDVYIVNAHQYVKNINRTFYFGDFSVMTDIMDNPSYVRKSNDIVSDMTWGLYIYSKLDKHEISEYKKQFKQYHKQMIKNDEDFMQNL